MRKRTRSREFALQILYQADISGTGFNEVVEDFWNEIPDSEKNEPGVRDYAERLAQGTLEHLAKIDATIERYAENWAMNRMACVDRNILRLSAYELMHVDDMPVKVAINEAVELAKRFGEPDSSKFVNGILDRIAKTECKK